MASGGTESMSRLYGIKDQSYKNKAFDDLLVPYSSHSCSKLYESSLLHDSQCHRVVELVKLRFYFFNNQ